MQYSLAPLRGHSVNLGVAELFVVVSVICSDAVKAVAYSSSPIEKSLPSDRPPPPCHNAAVQNPFDHSMKAFLRTEWASPERCGLPAAAAAAAVRPLRAILTLDQHKDSDAWPVVLLPPLTLALVLPVLVYWLVRAAAARCAAVVLLETYIPILEGFEFGKWWFGFCLSIGWIIFILSKDVQVCEDTVWTS